MPFQSKLYPHEPFLGDGHQNNLFVPPSGHATGFTGRKPEGYAGVAEPFPRELIIPRNEWKDRIEEKEAKKTNISHLVLQSALPPHDQNGVPYCWIHGPTGAMEALRVLQNQPMVLLSATSAGCKIKNFKSEGGWGKEGLEYIAKHGLVPQSLWPENKLEKQYDTSEAWEAAKGYICTEWWELKPNDDDELVSCCLRNIPTAVGYNWWGHEVYACDAVWVDGKIGIRIRNSWGDWGDKGFGILQGSKMNADDQVCPRVATAA